MKNKKNKNAQLLKLLSAFQKTQLYQSDVQLKQVIKAAIDSLNKGDAPDIAMVRLAPFLDQYLISNPVKNSLIYSSTCSEVLISIEVSSI